MPLIAGAPARAGGVGVSRARQFAECRFSLALGSRRSRVAQESPVARARAQWGRTSASPVKREELPLGAEQLGSEDGHTLGPVITLPADGPLGSLVVVVGAAGD